MKIALLILFMSASVALAAKYPVSISTTNGSGFGTTVISSLVGKINSGNVTNAAGSRVAYLSDVGAGSATNAVTSVFTNGTALIASGATNIDFVAGANTTVTGAVVGATAVIGISSSPPGTAGYSNSVSFQNASATLSNVVSQSSNRYVGSFVGLITTGNVTNASGSRVAYLSDTNGLGGGSGTTYTNNTDIAAKITGSGIGSNLTAYARLDAATNNFEFDMGVNGMFGTTTATASNLYATTIQGSYANMYGYWNSTSNLVGTNAIVISNFVGPTNTAVVGQVLHATSTAGDTKWDYVNQVLTNSNPVVPDFTLPVNYFVTNAAFLFLAPAGVETTGKKLQVTDVIVTNSTAAAVAVTFPGSIRVTGAAFITNLSVFHFRQFAGKWTNCACEPVW